MTCPAPQSSDTCAYEEMTCPAPQSLDTCGCAGMTCPAPQDSDTCGCAGRACGCAQMTCNAPQDSDTSGCAQMTCPAPQSSDTSGCAQMTCPAPQSSDTSGCAQMTCNAPQSSDTSGCAQMTCPAPQSSDTSGCAQMTCPAPQDSDTCGCAQMTCPAPQSSDTCGCAGRACGCAEVTCPAPQDSDTCGCAQMTCPAPQSSDTSGCAQMTCPAPQSSDTSGCAQMTCPAPQDSNTCGCAGRPGAQGWAQERHRQETFAGFPQGCPVSVGALARAGFIYTGQGDRVECFSCHTTVEGWLPGDSAPERHKQLAPSCEFIAESAFLESDVDPVAQNDRDRTENGSGNSALPCALDDPEVEADYLLRTRQVVDMSDSLYPKNPAMCSEETRLKSFHNWPLAGQLTPQELANAGFYYTGLGDQVACFCCGGKLKNWEPSDRAWSEHKRHFPKCLFVLGRDVGNVSSESVPAELGLSGLDNAQHPRNPSMAKYGKRLQTFLSWMYPVDKEQLAEAGFYSVGKGDHVVCFHCGGGLQEWKANEDPWDQHAKWFPGCRFVIKEKGIEFINNVHLRDGCRDSTTEAAEGTILPKDDLLQNPLVQSAIAMGFSLSEIRNTMEKRLQMTGESHTSVEDLVADLSAHKENTREEEPNEMPVEQDEQLIQLQNLYLSTEEQLRRLQEEKLCKICMAKDVSVVFIPCGHLVACKECAQVLKECPLCRTDIMKIQEIFMY